MKITFLLVALTQSCSYKQHKLTEKHLNWPGKIEDSTYELAMNDEFFFMVGQNVDHISKVDYEVVLLTKNSRPMVIKLDLRIIIWSLQKKLAIELVG